MSTSRIVHKEFRNMGAGEVYSRSRTDSRGGTHDVAIFFGEDRTPLLLFGDNLGLL